MRELRQFRQMKIHELAEAINLDPGFLGQIERGVGVPSVKTLANLSSALNVPLTELCRDAVEGPSEDFLVRETVGLLRKQGPKERKLVLTLLRELSKFSSKN